VIEAFHAFCFKGINCRWSWRGVCDRVARFYYLLNRFSFELFGVTFSFLSEVKRS